MPAILPLYPDTPLSPDTLLHPDGVWIEEAWLFKLALSLALMPTDPEPHTECAVVARSTSTSVPTRTTTISVPTRTTSVVELDQVV